MVAPRHLESQLPQREVPVQCDCCLWSSETAGCHGLSVCLTTRGLSWAQPSGTGSRVQLQRRGGLG